MCRIRILYDYSNLQIGEKIRGWIGFKAGTIIWDVEICGEMCVYAVQNGNSRGKICLSIRTAMVAPRA